MSTILITEFITSKALDFLSQKYAVIYQPDSYSRRFDLLKLSSEVDAIIVRNLTQVDQELLSCFNTWLIGSDAINSRWSMASIQIH